MLPRANRGVCRTALVWLRGLCESLSGKGEFAVRTRYLRAHAFADGLAVTAVPRPCKGSNANPVSYRFVVQERSPVTSLVRSTACRVWLLMLPLALGQSQSRPSYITSEEYCRKIPDSPLCRDGRPINLKPLTQPLKVQIPVPKNLGGGSSSAPRGASPTRSQAAAAAAAGDWRKPMSAEPLPPGEVRRRLEERDPGLMVAIRPKALLESKWMGQTVMGVDTTAEQAQQAGAVAEVRITMSLGTDNLPHSFILFNGETEALAKIGETFRSRGVTACFVDVNHLLLWQYGDVTAAVSRIVARQGTKSAAGKPEEAKESADIEMSMRRDFFRAQPAAVAGLPEGVNGISIAMRVRDRLHYELLLSTVDAAAAARLMEQANAHAWRVLGGTSAGQVPEFLKDVKAEKTARGILLTFAVDPALLPPAVVDQLRSGLGPLREALGLPAVQKKAVIHGL